MVHLPPVAPTIGVTGRVRLGRDYYVRIAGNDYSVGPRAIGRFVDWMATPDLVAISCADQIVATHQRLWTTGATLTDPDHRDTAKILRADLADLRRQTRAGTRLHPDGHAVAMRALPDYDTLFGVNFDPTPNTQQRRIVNHRRRNRIRQSSTTKINTVTDDCHAWKENHHMSSTASKPQPDTKIDIDATSIDSRIDFKLAYQTQVLKSESPRV